MATMKDNKTDILKENKELEAKLKDADKIAKEAEDKAKEAEKKVELLGSQFEEMKKQFEQMMIKTASASDKNSDKKTEEKEDKYTTRKQAIRLKNDDIIWVKSMVAHPVALRSGDQTIEGLRFDEPYEEIETDVKTLKACMRDKGAKSIVTEGKVYILNEQFVKEARLERYYKNFISPDEIENFLDLEKEEMLEKYEKMPLEQRRSVNTKIYTAIVNGEDVDYNIAQAIDKLHQKLQGLKSSQGIIYKANREKDILERQRNRFNK